VAAFEPSQEAFEKLLKNVAHNEVGEKVLLLPCGASNSTGSSALYHVPGRTEYSSFVPIVHPAASRDFIVSQDISTVTVDEVVSNHELRPAFLKVDVEGAEHLVIAGSRRTIQKHRPVILMEIAEQLLQSAGSSAQAVIEDIRSYDYVVIDPVKPRLQPGTRPFGDIVCFPKEDGRSRYISGTSLGRAR
jgi:FkbM family methyltransferase